MYQYKLIDHTADTGLEITGNTIRDIFFNAVKGLFHIIYSGKEDYLPDNISICNYENIELLSSGCEELLVKWLNEFIFLFYTKNKVPKDIQIEEINDNLIKAKVQLLHKYKETGLEIKSATYHELNIKKVKDKYYARIIFDV